MHLVFITSLIPHGALESGYDIANAAILAALRDRVDRLTVLGYAWPGGAQADGDALVLGEIDARTTNASLATRLAWLGTAVRTGSTFASAKFRIVEPEVVSARLQALPPIDAYVWNSVQVPGAYPELFRDRPALFVAHNVEHRSAEQNAAAAGGAFEALLYRREAALLKKFEGQLCRTARHVITLTAEDRDELGLTPEEATVLPLVTPAAVDAGARTPHVDAAMIGSWSWTPNRIGLRWFLDEVVPHLPKDFTVEIAGIVPEGIRPPRLSIRFVGRVPDATAFLLGARMVPLASRAGTGVQLKTLETFELGLPAVATGSSLRGIAHLPRNVIVADDPAAFAAALVRQARQGVRVDGSDFHAGQRKALGLAMDRALAALVGHAAGTEAA